MALPMIKQYYWKLLTWLRGVRPPYALMVIWRYARLHLSLRNHKKPESTQPRSLALFVWLFPPLISGGVYRPTALVRYAASAGWKVSVIAGPVPHKPSAAGLYLLDQIPSSVTIARVPEFRSRPAFWLPSLDGGFIHGVEGYFKAIALLERAPPAVVMASGPPFHNFVAAYFTARRYGARLVLEYRDEWTQTPFDFVERGNANQRWEERCLCEADLVIFTTASQRQHLMRVYPFLDGAKCAVVANGWEPADAPPPALRRPPKDESRIVITFAGNLGDHTLPGPFLETLREALEAAPELRQRLRLRFLGQKSGRALEQIKRFRFQEILELIDVAPKPEAFQAIRDADALLILNTPLFERYMPGKLYEYLASGTPVLVYGRGGEVGRVVTELGAGPVIPENDARLLRQTIENISAWDMQAKRDIRDEWLARHTRETLSGKLLRLLDQLASKSATVIPVYPAGQDRNRYETVRRNGWNFINDRYSMQAVERLVVPVLEGLAARPPKRMSAVKRIKILASHYLDKYVL